MRLMQSNEAVFRAHPLQGGLFAAIPRSCRISAAIPCATYTRIYALHLLIRKATRPAEITAIKDFPRHKRNVLLCSRKIR